MRFAPGPGGGRVLTPPTAVTDFPTVADLTWSASTDDTGVTGYSVYRDGTLISAAGKTSVRLPGLTAGKTYTFRITARGAAGNESEPSQVLKVTMPSGSDLALKKPVTASSSYAKDYAPEMAVDGDLSTRRARACPTRPGSRSTSALRTT
ncbi:fibronectin type III domain-containing protein [Streptomyces violaceusniger]|uniref:fibronectin type III domain-containing protein n=1 Tax=Streptomyces violaceusniger TaxID=68280 RepID=UPI0038159EDC